MQLPTTQLGPFRINREIGRGGMAIVYHAIDTRSGSEIALKILKPEMGDEATSVRRFEQEGKTALRLRHPNIVRAEEAGEIDGFHYIALEYVSKGTLGELLKEQGGPLSLEETTRLLRRVAMALDYAHNQRVLHRDVKPSNILIKQNGQSLLSDFGVARRMDRNYTVMTSTSQTIGTPSYMSPEQVHHDDEIDHRSDIYSLGVVAYNMLTGKLPFEARTDVTLLYKIAHETPTPPEQYNSKLPVGVRYALLRVLTKEPNARYNSAAEFIDALSDGPTWTPNKQDWQKMQADLGLPPEPEAAKRGAKASGNKERSSANIAALPAKAQAPEEISVRRRWGLPLLVAVAVIALLLIGRILMRSPEANETLDVATTVSQGESAATSVPATATVEATAPAIIQPSEPSPTSVATVAATLAPTEPAPVTATDPVPATATQGVEAVPVQNVTQTATPENGADILSAPQNQVGKPATSTPVPDLPTATLTPVPSDTPTPVPTSTATAPPTRTATQAPKPIATPNPTLAPTVAVVAVATTIPTPNLTVQLLAPNENDSVSGRRSFSWLVSGSLPAGYALEPVFHPVGVSAMASGEGWGGTTTGVQLEIDLTQWLAPGTYQWGVLLVESSPYRRHSLVSNQQTIRVERAGESGGSTGGSTGGGNNGGSGELQPTTPSEPVATETPRQ